MKKIIIIATLLLAVTVNAKSVKLYQTLSSWGEIHATYAINSELGRAWVNLVIDVNPSDPDVNPSDPDGDVYDKRVKVEGLSYDAVNKSILFVDGLDIIVCANYVINGWGIFKSEKLIQTGNCEFVETQETRYVDNGFEIIKRDYAIISLEVN